ncbi:MAG: thiamine pyrophosphate-requiring protein [Haloferacaceae archaeon]
MTSAGSTAATELLLGLADQGVEYLFANFGTDHTPILEAMAAVREAGRGADLPEVVVCPHEFVALSAAHGYAAATGRPQAVLVHVDVGTQNLGAGMHNAHRSDAPVFVVAGLAPVSDGDHPGARDKTVHYLQDVFDQPGIVREYCRWTGEYRLPGTPRPLVDRGLDRATASPPGPVYLTAGREALEAPVGEPTDDEGRGRERATPPRAYAAGPGIGPADADAVAEAVGAASAPLLITSKVGLRDGGAEAVEAFAEAAGAGVVEHRPLALSLRRDHDRHVGFDPHPMFSEADLVLAVDVDVPWIPADGRPTGAERIQIDPAPSKPTYPTWDFAFDRRIAADPVDALAAVTERLDAGGSGGGESDPWPAVASARRTEAAATLAADREAGRFTPAVVTDVVNDALPSSAVVLEDAVTSRGDVVAHLDRTEPGSYLANGGSGLGWGIGAGVGVKLARGDDLVVSLVGDGAYLFGQPSVAAWVAATAGAPTLTVIYDNQGWNAVRRATVGQHPEGSAARAGVPESRFATGFDLSAPAQVVDAYTRVAEDEASLATALAEAIEAVEAGRPAVIDAKMEPI